MEDCITQQGFPGRQSKEPGKKILTGPGTLETWPKRAKSNVGRGLPVINHADNGLCSIATRFYLGMVARAIEWNRVGTVIMPRLVLCRLEGCVRGILLLLLRIQTP